MDISYESSRTRQIQNFINNLTKKNFEKSKSQIYELMSKDLYSTTISYAFENVDFNIRSEKDQCIVSLLKDMFSWMQDSQAIFEKNIVFVFDQFVGQKVEALNFMVKNLDLSVDSLVGLGISFCQTDNINTLGLKIIKNNVETILKEMVVRSPNDKTRIMLSDFVLKTKEFESIRRRVLTTLDHNNFRIYNEKLEKTPAESFENIILKWGYYCFCSNAIGDLVFKKFLPECDENSCAHILSTMALTISKLEVSPDGIKNFLSNERRSDLIPDVKEIQTWNVEVFSECMGRYFDLDVVKIIECLDFPGFRMSDPSSFDFIVKFYRLVSHGTPFPVKVIINRTWMNTFGQASMIFYVLHQQLEELLTTPFRKIDLGSMRNKPNIDQNSRWNNLDLIDALLRLDKILQKGTNIIRSIFEQPSKHQKALLLLGLLQSEIKESELKEEIISFLLFHFIRSPKSNHGILTQLAKRSDQERAQVLGHLKRAYMKDPRYLTRIVNLIEEDRIIIKIVDDAPAFLSLSVAVCCSRRRVIDLHKFMQNLYERKGEVFLKECISFIGASIFNNKDFGIGKKITVHEYSVMVKFLQLATSNHKELRKQLHMIIERISMEGEIQDNVSQRLENSNFSIPEGADKWSTEFYEKVFSGKVTISDAIDTLKGYRDVPNQDYQTKYAAAIHNLIDEYRFFNQYPEIQLRKVATFMGELVGQDVVSGKTQNVIVVLVLKALETNPNSKMNRFGTIALSRFKHRARDIPKLYSYLSNNASSTRSDFRKGNSEYLSPPHKHQKINIDHELMIPPQMNMLNEHHLGNMSHPPPPLTPTKSIEELSPKATSPAVNITNPVGFNVNIKTLTKFMKEYEHVKPPEESRKKFQFILNNLTSGNLYQKVKEFGLIFEPRFMNYFGLTLVINRVSVELNNQELYFNFVIQYNDKPFIQTILRITYAAVRRLFVSDRIRSDFSERSLMKNLGAWLGLFTLRRNKPILKRELELKEWLCSAYQNGKLCAVVPFVCKILGAVNDSIVFKPPNPWTLGILSVLVEIHHLEKLKMNIKFDVEMIFKKLDVRIEQIPVKDVLKDIKMLILPDRNPDFRGKPTASISAKKFDISKIQLPPLNYPDLPKRVTVSNGITVFDEHPELKSVVVCALDQALKEVISPVVKRSVTIACRTTSDLVIKDYHMEKDVNKLTAGSNMMVQNLATNLAIVTCKNPLIHSMEGRLREYLNSMCIVEMDDEMRRLIGEASRRVTHENVHVGCYYVNKLATAKAKREMSQALKHEITSRKKHLETGGRAPFSLYPTMFREELKLVPPLPNELYPTEGIGELQREVYQDFNRLSEEVRKKSQQATQYQKKLGEIESQVQSIAHLVKGTKVVKRDNEQIRGHIETICKTVRTTPNIFEFSGDVIRYLLSRYYVTKNSFLKDVLVAVMIEICTKIDGNEHLSDTIFVRWTNLEADRKFSKDSVALVLSKILPISRFDMEISKNIAQNSQEAFLFAFRMIEETMIVERPLLSPQQFPRTLEGLVQRFRMIPQKYQEILKRVVNPTAVNNSSFDHGHPVLRMKEEVADDLEDEKRSKKRKRPGKETNHSKFIDSKEEEINQRRQRKMEDSMDMYLTPENRMPFASLSLKITEKRRKILQKFEKWVGLYEDIVERGEFDVFEKKSRERGNFPPSGHLSTFVIEEFQQPGLLGTDTDFINICQLLTHLSVTKFHSVNHNTAVSHHQLMKEKEEKELKKKKKEKEMKEKGTTETNGMESDDDDDELFRMKENGSWMDLEKELTKKESFRMIDAFTGLITAILRVSNRENRVALLERCLTVICDYLAKDHGISVIQKKLFFQVPYVRMISNLLVCLSGESDPEQILTNQFSAALISLEPNKCPGFLFGWIDLISHRYYIRRLMESKNARVYEDYHSLMIMLFRFVYPFFAKAQLTPPMKQVYKSILRILLVLLHDFSEFLCVYHFSLIDAIPPNCIQMRNLILSAFPRTMKLPDPFTPNLKVDMLPEIKQSPQIFSDYKKVLMEKGIMVPLRNYLKSEPTENEEFCGEMIWNVMAKFKDREGKYDNSLMNSIVLYIGVETTSYPQFKGRTVNQEYQILHQNGLRFFDFLARVLDYEGRYIFFNSLANQLRYPNNQTHFFSFVILTLFHRCRMENGDEIVQAQLTRVLLERLIVNRPHPWGLLVTFIELVKNTKFGFWNMRFIHCAPSIERLFANVGRSCLRSNEDLIQRS